MVYITLDKLKEILPDIFNEWMDGGDESWEWIFQEIEQKCHVGKRKKDKKRKKHKKDDVSTLKNDISVLSDRSRELNKKVDELDDKISKLNDICNAHTVRLDRFGQDIKAAKFMAQTAKDRTQVDYSKYSGKSDCKIDYNKKKSDADVVQEVYNRMSGRGATFEELNAFRNLIQKYDALEKKEIPVVKKMCKTCKYSSKPDGSPKSFDDPPCCSCNHNDKWEAKDNG